ncbi:hypothetical protein [Dasania marina]|uniref:hypothetical protein n=1 Tax=Dasania marina TaxID=471499 RepID=UPI0030D92C70|tara:strand:+ start:1641 stop:1850 length:210 start_codon:yes stop_codon:yes gene_type:complete
MKHLGDVREGAFNLIKRYAFETAQECENFVTKERAKGVWAFRECAGVKGGKLVPSTVACIRIECFFEAA